MSTALTRERKMTTKHSTKLFNNIHIVIGTKAQLIKMAPIMAELQRRDIDYRFVFTGQHKETITKLRENFGIKSPDITLHKGKDITGIVQMFFWVLRILYLTVAHKRRILGPTTSSDILLVHGDTFSTLLGALMGKVAGINVGHVESGLRSFNLWNPFPEEIVRILTFRLSDHFFCPGEWAIANVEGFKGAKINTKHNTLYDSLCLAKERFEYSNVAIPETLYAVCTIHRFETIFKKERFEETLDIIIEISRKIRVLFILHPPTKNQLMKLNLMEKLSAESNIELRPRYDYFDFIKLVDSSEYVLSDGGSNQEECYYLGKPCLLLRNTTERMEGLEENTVLSKFDRSVINDFCESYQTYKNTSLKLTALPSKAIVDYLAS